MYNYESGHRGENLVKNGDFASGALPPWNHGGVEATTYKGKTCAKYTTRLMQNEQRTDYKLQYGHRYFLSFSVSASAEPNHRTIAQFVVRSRHIGLAVSTDLPTTDWVTYEANFEIPPHVDQAECFFELLVLHVIPNPEDPVEESVYITDVVFVDLDEA